MPSRRLRVLVVLALTVVIAGTVAGSVAAQSPGSITTETFMIPARDPGIQLHVRNKRPAGQDTFTPERIVLFVHGATYPGSSGFDLDLPVSYDYATGTARYEHRFFNLAPTGREIDYELAYGVGLWGGHLDLNAFFREDPGHIEAMKQDVGAAIRFTLTR